MHSKIVLSTVMALSLAAGGIALAQAQGSGNDRGRNDQAQRGGEQDRRGDEGRPQSRQPDRGRPDRNFQRQDGPGAGPNHDFRKGGRLPQEYRNRQYVVDDWRGHNLRAPPRGYHWVQTGGDYVLAAIATGIIADLLLNR